MENAPSDIKQRLPPSAGKDFEIKLVALLHDLENLRLGKSGGGGANWLFEEVGRRNGAHALPLSAVASSGSGGTPEHIRLNQQRSIATLLQQVARKHIAAVEDEEREHHNNRKSDPRALSRQHEKELDDYLMRTVGMLRYKDIATQPQLQQMNESKLLLVTQVCKGMRTLALPKNRWVQDPRPLYSHARFDRLFNNSSVQFIAQIPGNSCYCNAILAVLAIALDSSFDRILFSTSLEQELELSPFHEHRLQLNAIREDTNKLVEEAVLVLGENDADKRWRMTQALRKRAIATSPLLGENASACYDWQQHTHITVSVADTLRTGLVEREYDDKRWSASKLYLFGIGLFSYHSTPVETDMEHMIHHGVQHGLLQSATSTVFEMTRKQHSLETRHLLQMLITLIRQGTLPGYTSAARNFSSLPMGDQERLELFYSLKRTLLRKMGMVLEVSAEPEFFFQQIIYSLYNAKAIGAALYAEVKNNGLDITSGFSIRMDQTHIWINENVVLRSKSTLKMIQAVAFMQSCYHLMHLHDKDNATLRRNMPIYQGVGLLVFTVAIHPADQQVDSNGAVQFLEVGVCTDEEYPLSEHYRENQGWFSVQLWNMPHCTRRWRLKALVVQFSGKNSGGYGSAHYVSYVRSLPGTSGNWFCFNDLRAEDLGSPYVSKAVEHMFEASTEYRIHMLFFEEEKEEERKADEEYEKLREAVQKIEEEDMLLRKALKEIEEEDRLAKEEEEEEKRQKRRREGPRSKKTKGKG